MPNVGLNPSLFLSTFDLPGQVIVAERGAWVGSSGPEGISLVPSVYGGQELEFDNTQLEGAELFLKGLFAAGARIDEGNVRLTLRVVMDGTLSAWNVGFTTDSPTSEFVPVTGSGDNGHLWVERRDTGNALPVDTDLYFLIEVWRETRFDDWQYAVTVQYQLPSSGGGEKLIEILPSSKTGTLGTIDCSRYIPVIGLRLEKPHGLPGVIRADSVRVTYKPYSS
ncbi:MAG: hypothetical protein V2A76_15290 [Planctomycetota bacterium]